MSLRFLRIFSLLTLCLWLGACSQTKEEEAADAIDAALHYLSQGDPDCQEAIDVLEDVSGQGSNVRYLQTLASAYACRGGFSELNFFDEIDTIDADNFLTSLAQLSTSAQTEAQSDAFDDLQYAINILLYSGSRTTPSAAVTKTKFGNRHGSNINLQAAYMIIAQLGRYVRWYGNTDAAGVKGGGPSGNTCFFDYDSSGAPTPLSVATAHGGGNACTAGNSGSPDLDYAGVTTAVAQRRMCHGIMLVNNLLDILENTTLSTNDALGDLTEVYDEVEPYITSAALLDPAMPDLIDTLAQVDCETIAGLNDRTVQLYLASVFEGGLP
jgi:hypothetical protein